MPPKTLYVSAATVDHLSTDLLPGWYADEWALLEAERWRQLRLHALEALAESFITAKEFARAESAVQVAVQADPERYAQRLRDELGLHPTRRLFKLVADVQR
ncbi:hypothetical protein [Streptomyces sp. NPDC055134]